jgi:predicted RecB family nuclease
MRITSPVFDAFLKCATKGHLRSLGEIGSGNEYAEWVRVRDESYQREAARGLQEGVPETERVVAPPATENLKAAKWRLAVDLVAQTPGRFMDSSLGADAMLTDHEPPRTHPSPCPLPAMRGEGGRRPGEGTFMESDVRESEPGEETRGLGGPRPEQVLESRLHAVERVPSEGRGKPAQFVPIRFVFRNKLTKDDRLLLAFDALVLSQALGREVSLGKIIHGDDHATLKVKTSALASGVRKRLEKTAALLSSPAPPDLVLNRHCAECEFQARCRKIAVEKDDLSLLARMNEKERQKLRSKGIFTVTQLSYTFRPRRRPKRLRDKREQYHHSLKALAIREKKIHIVGSPELKIEGTPVYLDVEGLPDRDFYYLIGLRIGNGDSAIQHSLWADTVEDEGKIWREFLGILETVEKPVLIHYGSYETTFLKRMSERHGSPGERSVAATGLASPVNLLSVIFAQIYFPVSSNGLKDTAGFLGFTWANAGLSGLNSVAWRHRWEELFDGTTKEMLLTYNAQDCEALNLMTDRVSQLAGQLGPESPTQAGGVDVVHADAEQFQHRSRWRAFTSPVTGFEKINAAAHWDYQRHRVYARSGKAPKKAAPPHPRNLRPEQAQLVVVWPASRTCPKCQRKVQSKATQKSTTVHDIVFGRHSLKRRVVKHMFRTYHCRQCRIDFGMEERFRLFRQYGWNLVAYLFFQLVELNIPQLTVVRHFNRLFRFDLSTSTLNNMKTRVAGYYAATKQKILEHIIPGRLVHADETRANIKGKTGFVWVLTSNSEVVYILADSREGEMVQKLLAGFKGVLVSDFYTAYDSIGCLQQRCLIHLMRDLNEEVLNNPFDTELKQVVTAFAELLQPMVETVDHFGLKSHFLKKHLADVARFYGEIGKADYRSEAATKCKERFERNQDKLFTFLSHDGVPWHNNNAEHAIKAFARLRDVIAGTSTEKGLEEYLTLLSVCQTCKYMGVDFLDFLRSGEKDIHAFAESRRGRRRRAQTSQADGLPADAIPGPGIQP